jgi:hypothetical protein
MGFEHRKADDEARFGIPLIVIDEPPVALPNDVDVEPSSQGQ